MKRILLIEDDVSQRYHCRQELEATGYEILEADGCETARAKLTASDVDLVIMELMLANSSGLELLERIALEWRGLPVIINTAYEMFRFDFKTWMADAFLVKSPDLTELKSAVVKLLDRGLYETSLSTS